jgi:GTP cyclohydrolase IA
MDRPSRAEAVKAVKILLSYVCDDPTRAGIQETPERVVKAFEDDWCAGYKQSAETILKTFEDGGEHYKGILFIGSIALTSLCEHHVSPIIGVAHFGYIPDNKIVGLSKIPRLIDMFAKRLQVQERLSSEIVDTFMKYVECQGCGLVIKARHMCMESRGIRAHGIETTTSDMRGNFLTDESLKAEFMSLVRDERK